MNPALLLYMFPSATMETVVRDVGRSLPGAATWAVGLCDGNHSCRESSVTVASSASCL